jgi:hypothetical protein
VRRGKDYDWDVYAFDNGEAAWDKVQIIVLMDIRDELKKLNALLRCENFVSIPRTLKGIRKKLPVVKP